MGYIGYRAGRATRTAIGCLVRLLLFAATIVALVILVVLIGSVA